MRFYTHPSILKRDYYTTYRIKGSTDSTSDLKNSPSTFKNQMENTLQDPYL